MNRGSAWHVAVRPGEAGYGEVWQSWRVPVGHVRAGTGAVRCGSLGVSWPVLAGHGSAGHGLAGAV